MKSLTLSLLIVASFAATTFAQGDSPIGRGLGLLKRLPNADYLSFLTQFNKRVQFDQWDDEKKFKREQRFLQVRKQIQEFMARKDRTFDVAINEFADRLPEQLVNYTGADPSLAQETRALPALRSMNITPPASLDYRPFASAVQNQGNCGSCWAFSTLSMIETFYNIITNNRYKKVLSEQYLVDCDTYDNGCNGGWPSRTLSWIKNVAFNMPLDSSYLYTSGSTGARTPTGCKKAGLLYSQVPFKNFYEFKPNGNEELTKKLLYAYGPLVSTMAVPLNCPNFYGYRSGVYQDYCGCSNACTNINHGVVLMGYGTDAATGKKFWLIQNSWGSTWGEGGYMRILRGPNTCSITCNLFGVET